MATSWTRRGFLGTALGAGTALICGDRSWARPRGDDLAKLIRQAPTARYWVSAKKAKKRADCLACHAASELPEDLHFAHEGNPVRCLLCAQRCLIEEGDTGRCHARINVGGTLKSLVYGRPITVHVDPIEKKPFFHFLPGRQAYSLATSGCPLHCRFCQNWEISQALPQDYHSPIISPERITQSAIDRHIPIVAFTYNEATVFTEYLTDIARINRQQKLRSVLISCGFMNEAPLSEMCSVLDAIKIDLKGFSEEFYHTISSAALAPVLRSIKQVARSGTHLELVNLVIPTLNDSTAMLQGLVGWVLGEIGPDVPVHFTRFHPDYQLRNLPPTPIATLEKARDIAMTAGMHYAYVGNVPGHPGNSTYCPHCGKIVIKRHGFFVLEMHLKHGRCAYCGTEIPGVWK